MALSQKFVMRSALLSERFSIELTADEFNEFNKCRLFLSDYIKMEEDSVQLLLSLQDFERFIFDCALEHRLFPSYGIDYTRDIRLRANLRVISFLNSLSSLRDQFPRFRSATLGIDLREKFRSLWQETKSKNVTFWFCERIRNFAQHQTQPISFHVTGSQWDKDRIFNESYAAIYVDVEEVVAHREIKREEAESYRAHFGRRADLSLVIREASSCTAQIIKKMRTVTTEDYENSYKTYAQFLARAEAAGAQLRYCHIASLIDGLDHEKHDVFGEFLERAAYLRRHPLAINNHNHFISNKALGHQRE